MLLRKLPVYKCTTSASGFLSLQLELNSVGAGKLYFGSLRLFFKFKCYVALPWIWSSTGLQVSSNKVLQQIEIYCMLF